MMHRAYVQWLTAALLISAVASVGCRTTEPSPSGAPAVESENEASGAAHTVDTNAVAAAVRIRSAVASGTSLEAALASEGWDRQTLDATLFAIAADPALSALYESSISDSATAH